MAWKCAECTEPEGDGQQLVVCHHCGKPLCEKDRRQIHDPVFAARAFHCEDCRGADHPRSASGETAA